jgi:hypothetical protein
MDLNNLRYNPKLYFLKEEYSFYSAIGRKVEMYENWGIEVRNEMPGVAYFRKASTFESEFTHFVKSIIPSENLAIESDADKLKEEEKAACRDRIYKMEYEMGQTIMDYIISKMCYDLFMDELNNIELKI